MAQNTAELWVRVSTASQANSTHWDAEFAVIDAVNANFKAITGVRANIALSGEISATVAGDLTYWQDCVDRIASRGLKIAIGIGGEGPNKTVAAWKALNGATEWTYNRRPVKGTANGVWLAMVALKQRCIDYAVTKYRSLGYIPSQYIEIEVDNEPGTGGSGGFGLPVDGSFGGITVEGYWDSSDEVTATALVASFQERLAFELPRLNFYGCEVLCPSFEFQDGTTSLKEVQTAFNSTDSPTWMAYITKLACNLYYTPSGTACPAPDRFAKDFMMGVNQLGTNTNCAKYKIDQMLSEFNGNDPRSRTFTASDVRVTEVGASLASCLMPTYYASNHNTRGQAINHMIRECGNYGVSRVTLYTVRDDTYGLLAANDSATNAYTEFKELGGVYA